MKKKLRWGGGWQNDYAEAAAELGYHVAWNGWGLNVYKEGFLIGNSNNEAFKGREFCMEDFIEGVEKAFQEKNYFKHLKEYIQTFKNPNNSTDFYYPVVFLILPNMYHVDDTYPSRMLFDKYNFKGCNVFYFFDRLREFETGKIQNIVKDSDFLVEYPNWERDRTPEQIQAADEFIDSFNVLIK